MIQRHLALTHRCAACGLFAAALLFALGTTGLAQHTTSTPPIAVQGPGDLPTRSVRITSSEVTDPDVAVSPDGKWMIITALGHLFRLSTAGGPTQQLTSGPYYDAAPAISPDGTSVAFISDRVTTPPRRLRPDGPLHPRSVTAVTALALRQAVLRDAPG